MAVSAASAILASDVLDAVQKATSSIATRASGAGIIFDDDSIYLKLCTKNNVDFGFVISGNATVNTTNYQQNFLQAYWKSSSYTHRYNMQWV